MLKKTAIAASVTVALATASLPASSAIFAAAEGLLVPVFVANLILEDWDRDGRQGMGPTDEGGFNDTEVRVSIPATIGFDGLINNFTAPNTTPTNPGALLSPRMKSFTDPDGNMRGQNIAWFWFDQYSGKVIDGTRKVTPDDVEIIRASDILPPYLYNQLGYLVITSEGSGANFGAKGASMVMFGDARIEVSDDVVDDNQGSDWVNLPVLGLTDGPDNGLAMPTKKDNIKWPNPGDPVVSPLVTGMRTNVSNGKLGATTVFELPVAPATVGPNGAWTDNIHVVWLDMNRFDITDIILEACLPGSPARLGGYIYDTAENRQSWGGCIPWELTIDHFDTDEINIDFPAVDLLGGGFIQYQLPEYYDAAGVLGPQTSGIAFSINEVADDDFVTTLANERGMYNEGCGVQDPTCVNNYNDK